MPLPTTTPADAWLSAADSALRTLLAKAHSERPSPASTVATVELTTTEQALSGALMRVNHVGEVCAQALYTAQALATKDTALQSKLRAAAQEETDHLAWTAKRLQELHARPSLLNPLWYAGAFGLGFLAGKLGGDKLSLGFVVETEAQVEAHLQSHLTRLPLADHASRAIVAKMQSDEARHGQQAQQAGAATLPAPVKHLMGLAAKVMTTVAHRV
jgi:ubiquinone biosynthesis monooxygenase Coq7